MDVKKEIAARLAEAAGIGAEEVEGWLETPPNPDMGQLAFPCFKLARTMRKAPPAIAAELSKLAFPASVTRAEVAGGYLNFFIDGAHTARTVLERVLREGEAYGGSAEGAGKTALVEYSSINIAKPVHIGHLFSTALGNSLARIYKHLGYNVVSINHLGDWGTQFGKMIVAYKLWGDRELVEREGVRGLVKLYVRFHEEAETDKSLEDDARAWFRKIELGDSEAMELFNWFKELSLKDVMRVYDLLDVRFDSYAGESFYEDKMQAVIDELGEKGLLTVDNGATIVDLSEYNMPPCIILKKDGATLYATRDLAAAKYRKATYDFARSLYVVAYQQNLHFKQFFKVLELMGYGWVKDMEHVNFGMVSMEEGTLSTRHGNIVYLEDVLNAAIAKTREIIEEKSPELENKDEAARAVGVGAVVWGMLYNSRIKDVTFSWDKMLNFDGETGPYAQYTHARCCSVLRRAGEPSADIDFGRLTDESAMNVLRALEAFPDAVHSAMEKNEPYLVARAVIEICGAFNRFYYNDRIMDDDPATANARLALTAAARTVIATGLRLMGLRAPEQM